MSPGNGKISSSRWSTRTITGVLQEPKIGLLRAVSSFVQTVSPVRLLRAVRKLGSPGPCQTNIQASLDRTQIVLEAALDGVQLGER